MTERIDVAIVGAGILGLAHAYAAAKRGLRVAVFERSPRAAGASVRNFGMIWPIGQPAGTMLQMALNSRRIWLEILTAANLPYQPTGSLHVAYRDDEAAVAREFSELAPGLGYSCEWLSPSQVTDRSAAIRPEGLQGGLWSATEMAVDPRLVLASLPSYLSTALGVRFHFGVAVHSIDLPEISAGADVWLADRAIVCGGDDFETLYPAAFAKSGITRCKLQMLRTVPQAANWNLGPSLAGGLTLRFYPSFGVCTSLPAFRLRVASEMPEYDRWGIHVMASQTACGEITLGDSHEYGLDVDIFNKSEIDRLILAYAHGFLRLPDFSIAQHWHGVYAKHPDKPFVAMSPARNVHIVTAPGGSGMTLSFGLAEATLRDLGL